MRVQLALNVRNLDEAVAYYSKLFGAKVNKRKPGYANFAIDQPPLKLVLLEVPNAPERLNHLGVEVFDQSDVDAAIERLSRAGIAGEVEVETTCCHAKQNKVWSTDPGAQPATQRRLVLHGTAVRADRPHEVHGRGPRHRHRLRQIGDLENARHEHSRRRPVEPGRRQIQIRHESLFHPHRADGMQRRREESSRRRGAGDVQDALGARFRHLPIQPRQRGQQVSCLPADHARVEQPRPRGHLEVSRVAAFSSHWREDAGAAHINDQREIAVAPPAAGGLPGWRY